MAPTTVILPTPQIRDLRRKMPSNQQHNGKNRQRTFENSTPTPLSVHAPASSIKDLKPHHHVRITMQKDTPLLLLPAPIASSRAGARGECCQLEGDLPINVGVQYLDAEAPHVVRTPPHELPNLYVVHKEAELRELIRATRLERSGIWAHFLTHDPIETRTQEH